jgi:hypothetical protein
MLAAVPVAIGGCCVFTTIKNQRIRAERIARLPVLRWTEFEGKKLNHFTYERHGNEIVVAYFVEPERPRAFRLDLEGKPVEEVTELLHSRVQEILENVRCILQWETLGRNRDRPRKPPLPRPSTLRLCKLRAHSETGSANRRELKATDESAPQLRGSPMVRNEE